MRVFPPSTVPHPWRQTAPVVMLAVAWAVVLYLGVLGVAWLAIHAPGSWDWSFVPVTG